MILKKFNAFIVLQVKSDEWICVSVNPIMLLFIILSSLTISFISFESACALEGKVVMVLSNILLNFIEEYKSFCFQCSYSNNTFLLTFIEDFLKSAIQ